jgi:hypothetical protein
MVRATRAAVFAGVCMVLTVAGHALAEGRSVAPAALAIGFVAVFVAGLAAGRRERSQVAITLGVFAGQLGLHLLFSLPSATSSSDAGKSTATDSMAGPMAHMAHMNHMDMAGMAGMASSGAGMAGHGGLVMLAAHVGAGAVAGWWLRGGEAACWRLLRRAESAAACAVRATVASIIPLPGYAGGQQPPLLCPVMPHGPGRAMSIRLARCSPRRGPPLPGTHLLVAR